MPDLQSGESKISGFDGLLPSWLPDVMGVIRCKALYNSCLQHIFLLVLRLHLVASDRSAPSRIYMQGSLPVDPLT